MEIKEPVVVYNVEMSLQELLDIQSCILIADRNGFDTDEQGERCHKITATMEIARSRNVLFKTK